MATQYARIARPSLHSNYSRDGVVFGLDWTAFDAEAYPSIVTDPALEVVSELPPRWSDPRTDPAALRDALRTMFALSAAGGHEIDGQALEAYIEARLAR